MNNINYVTVSQLNNYIKKIMDNNGNLQNLYIKGEISNFKHHSRGHFYFTLKDEESRLNAVMFATNAKTIKFVPTDGMKVLINGKISAYPSSGSYQIYVNEMNSDGLGNLHIAYEQLKLKLEKEGLFSDKYKKRIPKMPKRIGIITASTGAAIKDIITTLKRRFPLAETLLLPSLVQGDGAKESIVKQIKEAENHNIDVLIVGRGGGSIEDLWAFNEEIVARAIFECKIPIISAVGHEIDYTISDFVADLRAPTPTAAAELVVPNQIDIFTYLNKTYTRMSVALKKKIDYLKLLLNKYHNSYILKNPISIYELKSQKLDNLIDKVNINIKQIITINKNKIDKISNNYILNNTISIYELKCQKLNTIIDKVNINIKQCINNSKVVFNRISDNYILNNPNILLDKNNTKLDNIIDKLKLLNPLNVLDRGYSIVKKDNKVIKYSELSIDDEINIEVKDGKIISKIINMEVK